MRNTQNQNKNRGPRPAWVEMFAKTRSVEAGSGRDWHTDVPNIKLSRAFVVVLVLHVVAIGGLIAFELFGPDNESAAEAVVAEKKDSIKKVSADAPAPAAGEREAPMTPAAERDQRRGGYESYIVQAGDSIRRVAERYRISRTELLTANRIDEQHPLVAGRLLRIPKALLPGGSSSNLQPVSADIDRRETPPISSSLTGNDLLTDTPPAELSLDEGTPPADDGFVQLGGSDKPVTEDTPVEPVVASESSDYQPASVNADEENARIRIVTPNNDKPKVVRKLNNGTTKPVSTGRSHTVAAGETLYRISRKYGVSVDAILGANPGVKASSLGIGKTLRIP